MTCLVQKVLPSGKPKINDNDHCLQNTLIVNLHIGYSYMVMFFFQEMDQHIIPMQLAYEKTKYSDDEDARLISIAVYYNPFMAGNSMAGLAKLCRKDVSLYWRSARSLGDHLTGRLMVKRRQVVAKQKIS